jgi:hypothetical protein
MKLHRCVWGAFLIGLVAVASCAPPGDFARRDTSNGSSPPAESSDDSAVVTAAVPTPDETASTPQPQRANESATPSGAPAARHVVTENDRPDRLRPDDLEYLGAFRLPEGSNDTNWEYSGHALAYYPDGDAAVPDDGFPGSLFGTGHNWHQQISEIDVPVPVISKTKNLDELNTARTLQPFYDIRGALNPGELELPCAGMEYLPPLGAQQTGKLYFCWGQHYQFQRCVSHGWCEVDLENPRTAGGWYIGQRSNYSTNDYLFEIPAIWAERHAGGKRLATGRFRDGGWSGMGPALFAIGPHLAGNPPPPGATLEETPLLLYTSSEDFSGAPHTMRDYHHSDEWSGGAWLTAGDESAVVFVGTKGVGECWYGFSNGVVWPDEAPYPPVPDPPHDQRGWWSTAFRGEFIFYDPAELAAVAEGNAEPSAPQPYAVLEVDEHLFHVKSSRQWFHLGAAAFDRTRRRLFVLEPLADLDKSIIHVWQLKL